jgi:hypothetical protein
VILSQPLAQRRRQQKRLLTIARDEVLGHRRIVFTGPDGHRVYATASTSSESLEAPWACACVGGKETAPRR